MHAAAVDALRAAFGKSERGLTNPEARIDHVFSGTTAVVSWFFANHVYTAWAGDSRAVVGRLVADGAAGGGGGGEGMEAEGAAPGGGATGKGGEARYRAVELTHDQKPVRVDERKRVKAAGGRIARWRRNIGPLRVWLPKDWLPGLAMTRSIGDTVLSDFGVSPIPEVTHVRLTVDDSFIVLASDGVWEFMDSQTVVDFVGRVRRDGGSADAAAEALVREAVRRWRRNEVVVDDTTAVVMWLDCSKAEALTAAAVARAPASASLPSASAASISAAAALADAENPSASAPALQGDAAAAAAAATASAPGGTVTRRATRRVLGRMAGHGAPGAPAGKGVVQLVLETGRLVPFVCKNDIGQ